MEEKCVQDRHFMFNVYWHHKLAKALRLTPKHRKMLSSSLGKLIILSSSVVSPSYLRVFCYTRHRNLYGGVTMSANTASGLANGIFLCKTTTDIPIIADNRWWMHTKAE